MTYHITLQQRLINLLDLFLSSALRTGAPDELRKARLVAGACLFQIVCSVCLLPLLFYYYPPPVGLSVLGVIAIMASLLYALRRSSSSRGVSIAFLSLWYLYITLNNAMVGGFETMTFLWYGTLPLFATFFVGSRWSNGFITLSIVTLATFVTAKAINDPFPPKVVLLEPLNMIVGAIFFGIFLIALGFIATLYESARHLSQEALAREAQRNYTLAQERDLAQKASLAKSEFLANMSHELRTPLNAIIGYTEILQEESGANPSLEEFGGDLNKIHHAGHHLLQLISDVLDISKIEAGKLELTLSHFGLRLFLEELESATGSLIKRNNNTLVWHIETSTSDIITDQLRLRQCLINLISNAAKFTNDGKITLRVTEKKGEREGEPVEGYQFEVSDTGIGITSNQLEAVFDKFHQGDMSSTRKHGGTGLGLSITKELCQLLQGDISAESEYGTGSHFRIWLPKRFKEDTNQHISNPTEAQREALRETPLDYVVNPPPAHAKT